MVKISDINYIQADVLREYCQDLLVSAGVPRDEAFIVADSLVEADLTGIDSHGVSRMPIYLKRLRLEADRPVCQVKTITDYPTSATLDGCGSLGAVVGSKAMELTIEKAMEMGVGFVAVRNSNHFGTAAYFTKMALKHDMIGFSATTTPARMAPWGGKEQFLGTNPFSVAIPTGQEKPIIIDMATSVVARGRVLMAANNNQPIPDGWAINAEGEPTNDPREALKGTVLPFAGPKGYAIAILIDVFAGILSGASFGPHIKDFYKDFENPTDIGHVFGAVRVDRFIQANDFKENVDQMIKEIKASPKAKGVKEIFLPGEIESNKRELRLKEGIPIISRILKELQEEAATSNIPFTLA